MSNSWRLPSYIVPLTEIKLDGLKIIPANPVTVNDDWQREHWSGSVIAEEESHGGSIDSWIYLHCLFADSRLPLYSLHARGEEPSSFQVDEFDNKGNPSIVPRVINFDPTDILPAVYLDYEESVPTISYENAYIKYGQQDEAYFSAIKNYFIAQDINFHKRLRYIDTSYWQVVMLISTIEALLPAPVFCKGKCEECKKGIKHVMSDSAKDWNEILFDKITDKKVRKQYRSILDEVRWKIRNDTVHNGLYPGKSTWKSEPLPDGVTEFTTSKSLESYKTDRNSLESLIEQLQQICRYVLLDRIFENSIFPSLKGTEVHSLTITNTKPSVTINLDF